MRALLSMTEASAVRRMRDRWTDLFQIRKCFRVFSLNISNACSVQDLSHLFGQFPAFAFSLLSGNFCVFLHIKHLGRFFTKHDVVAAVGKLLLLADVCCCLLWIITTGATIICTRTRHF